MRYLAILLLLASCKVKYVPVKEYVIINRDSVELVQVRKLADSIRENLYNGAIVLKHRNDSLQIECKRLSLRVVNAEYTINRVRFYVGICNRKPAQSKFLRGWINRSLE